MSSCTVTLDDSPKVQEAIVFGVVNYADGNILGNFSCRDAANSFAVKMIAEGRKVKIYRMRLVLDSGEYQI